jgi:drug/metabolite transporter (DMT)-like permease
LSFNRRQLTVLSFLTLVWGINWPVMKLGATLFPPLTFRTVSMWLALPVLAAVVLRQGVPFGIARRHWRELAELTVANMLVWHVFAILAVRELSSGRAAILGYTMPVFSALWGSLLFGERLSRRGIAGVGAAALGVALLLWHELSALAGRPQWAAVMLFSAASWGYGTHRLRRTRIEAPTLVISFWMTVVTTLVMTVLAVAFERDRWHWPAPAVTAAIVYNALLIFGFAQPAWFFLARTLPPIASTLSVMMIPVLGVVSGALWLDETLHWQDYAAMALLLAAIASVLWPAARPAQRA